MTNKWSIGWGPISACNMKCKFCYSRSNRELPSNLEYLDWIRFIDNNAEHIGSINYGTGENTMSPEWFKLIDYIRTNYPLIRQSLTTNGYLSVQVEKSNEYHEIALKCIDEVDVSLDFAEAEAHSSFRGQPNAYSWAINTLEFCYKYSIPATIVFLGTDTVLDINNLQGLFDIAKKNNAKLRMNVFRPTMGLENDSQKFTASYNALINAILWINREHKILALSDPLFCSILTDDEDIIEIDHSGIDSMRILHNGGITPSTYLISKEFQNNSILDDINLSKYEFSNIPIPEDCKNCHLLKRCAGGVADRRYLWYKTFKERDPYCPFREGNYLPEEKIHIYGTGEVKSVHYGYLPTMFFEP